MLTSIVILTHNQWSVTERCVESIRRHTPEPYEIIVVDNGSTDETIPSLKLQSDVKLICNESNLGFPKGCNQGIEIASGENVLFLNNDTVVTKGWLTNMLRVLYADENVAMVGPVSNYTSGHQQIPVTYSDVADLESFANTHCAQYAGQWAPVRRLIGFCLLVKRSVLDEVGWFDERFGIGNYEDDDLCLRALQVGYTLKVAFDSFVHHEGHATMRNVTDVNFTKLMQENKQRAAEKWGRDIHDLIYQQSFPTRNHKVGPITISLCVIVRNEEAVISRCLNSVRDVVDEYVIVDTGSTDKTMEIAAEYTDKVFRFNWTDDFSAARNYAFDQATMEYIMWLDADDVMTDADREKLKELKQTLSRSVDAVNMEYHFAHDDAGNTTSKSWRYRIVRRSNHFRWQGVVNEVLQVSGNILESGIAVKYLGVEPHLDRNIQIYETRLARGASFTPRDLRDYANELFKHKRFTDAADFYQKFLNTNQGSVDDFIAVCESLADCFHNLNQPQKELECSIKSFLYDTPRAEVCCRVGEYFLQKSQWRQAIFWYELALNVPKPESRKGIGNNACWTWVPHVRLCACYNHLGDFPKAYEHAETALRYQPTEWFTLLNQ